MPVDDLTLYWYAIRVTYCREMLVKRHLDTLNIENFIPMRYKEVVVGERHRKIYTPAIHNLIFIHTTPARLREIKNGSQLPIRYIMDRQTGDPVTIPAKQMHDFIAIAGTCDEQVVYLDASAVELKRGDRVRIKSGLLCGVEGEFMRIKGDRRVVVSIQGVMAVATTFIHPSLIEKIE